MCYKISYFILIMKENAKKNARLLTYFIIFASK